MSMSFIVTGLNESIAHLTQIVNQAPQTKQQATEEAARFLAEQMRLNVHVITGNLRSSILSVGNSVTVSAPYAAIENARVGATKTGNSGPHDFASAALRQTMTAFPNIIMDAYSDWTATGGY